MFITGKNMCCRIITLEIWLLIRCMLDLSCQQELLQTSRRTAGAVDIAGEMSRSSHKYSILKLILEHVAQSRVYFPHVSVPVHLVFHIFKAVSLRSYQYDLSNLYGLQRWIRSDMAQFPRFSSVDVWLQRWQLLNPTLQQTVHPLVDVIRESDTIWSLYRRAQGDSTGIIIVYLTWHGVEFTFRIDMLEGIQFM